MAGGDERIFEEVVLLRGNRWHHLAALLHRRHNLLLLWIVGAPILSPNAVDPSCVGDDAQRHGKHSAHRLTFSRSLFSSESPDPVQQVAFCPFRIRLSLIRHSRALHHVLHLRRYVGPVSHLLILNMRIDDFLSPLERKLSILSTGEKKCPCFRLLFHLFGPRMP